MITVDDKIIRQFQFIGTLKDVCVNNSGLINKTYVLTYFDDNNERRKYILQNINTNVFKKPVELMENISKITEHIKRVSALEGSDVARSTLNIVKTIDGKLYYKDENDIYWRAYDFIKNAVAYNKIEKKEHFYNSGVALGQFQKKLESYPIQDLFETIENFHNTPVRYKNLCKAIDNNVAFRRSLVEKEIDFFKARESFYSIITNEIEAGNIPVRVTHNDTKINNVMLDIKTSEALCLIDLDTVMPGSALYDFGDSIRFGTNTSNEDEATLERVGFNIELFEAYTSGYLSEMKHKLTETEMKLLPESAILMTLECGMRFLTDYLEGDIYFGISHENHNLDRARNQIKLANEMEKNIEKMREIVSNQ